MAMAPEGSTPHGACGKEAQAWGYTSPNLKPKLYHCGPVPTPVLFVLRCLR